MSSVTNAMALHPTIGVGYDGQIASHHTVEIDLNNIPSQCAQYVVDVCSIADKHGISVRLKNKRSLILNEHEVEMKCNGYFCDGEYELAVACDQPLEQWFRVLVHESCHMDQFIEQCEAWTEGYFVGEVERKALIDLWLGYDLELTESQFREHIYPTMFVELDCERRAVKKIKEYELPIDVVHYIQQANSYVYFYWYIFHCRKWYTVGKEPYNNSKVVNLMPRTLDGDYENLPNDIKHIFDQYMEF